MSAVVDPVALALFLFADLSSLNTGNPSDAQFSNFTRETNTTSNAPPLANPATMNKNAKIPSLADGNRRSSPSHITSETPPKSRAITRPKPKTAPISTQSSALHRNTHPIAVTSPTSTTTSPTTPTKASKTIWTPDWSQLRPISEKGKKKHPEFVYRAPALYF